MISSTEMDDWDMGSVTNMRYLFRSAYSFDQRLNLHRLHTYINVVARVSDIFVLSLAWHCIPKNIEGARFDDIGKVQALIPVLPDI